MLRYWGVHLYGEWLLISTIPAYLLLTDLGFGNVAGSDMTMRVHAGDGEGAIRDISERQLLLVLSRFALDWHVPVRRDLPAAHPPPSAPQFHVPAGGAECSSLSESQLPRSFCSGTPSPAAFRCAGKYAIGLLYVNIIRMVEGMSFLVLLVWHAGPVQLSMLMLGISVVGDMLAAVHEMETGPVASARSAARKMAAHSRALEAGDCLHGLSDRQRYQSAGHDDDGRGGSRTRWPWPSSARCALFPALSSNCPMQ